MLFSEPGAAAPRCTTPVAGAVQRYHTDARSLPANETSRHGPPPMPCGSNGSAVAPIVVAAALVCFSAGFYGGNRRASALERYLDQVVLEIVKQLRQPAPAPAG